MVVGRPLRPADDEAIVITVPRGDAPYLGFQLGTVWYTSLDYTGHQTSLNQAQAQVDPDGMIRIVVAEHDPGVANWVERIGHDRGYLQFRWQRLERPADPEDGPTHARSSRTRDVPSLLPFHEQNTRDARSSGRRASPPASPASPNRMLG